MDLFGFGVGEMLFLFPPTYKSGLANRVLWRSTVYDVYALVACSDLPSRAFSLFIESGSANIYPDAHRCVARSKRCAVDIQAVHGA